MSSPSSIVVGVDFTACSAVALRQALRIARWSNAALHVAHVIDTLVVIELEEALSPMQRQIREVLVRDAEAAWQRFAAQIPGAEHLPIDISINNRVTGILQRIRAVHAELLVLGAFGDRPPDVGLGTLATACVRSSTTDVLLVRDNRDTGTPFRTIVAAVDFSDTSLRVLERAALLATHDGAELHVLHVFHAPWQILHYGTTTPVVAPVGKGQYRAGFERRLEAFCQPVLERHGSLRLHLTVHDYAGYRSGIVEHASNIAADLIVLGTRGRTNLRDILLGSTAEKALAESRCSVLAVKPEATEDR